MSIVPLLKVTVYGLLEEKEKVLDDLQSLGCLHLVSLQTKDEGRRVEQGPTPQAREALKFLLTCPQRRRQVSDPTNFNAEEVVRRTLEIQERILTLEDELDFLRRRIRDLTPWGDFAFPPLEDLKNLRLWFYPVPHHELKKVETADLLWTVVKRDDRFDYVVVVSEDEPQGMPVARTHTGSKSLSELQHRLEEVELELEDLQAERASLTRWCDIFAQNIGRLEDRASLLEATHQTYDETPLFAVQGWVPRENMDQVQKYTNESHLAIDIQEPAPGDDPPTLLHNPPKLTSGEDLVTFYQAPSYWAPDPSTTVFFSFVLFFAMILGDTGYGLVLGFFLLLIWKRLGQSNSGRRMRILFASLVGATIAWGMLVGSYFGAPPPEGSILARLRVLNLNDYASMMTISIVIGAFHVILANAMKASRIGRSQEALVPVGWIAMVGGSLILGLGGGPATKLGEIGLGILVLGAVLVLLFSGAGSHGFKRLLKGLQGLTGISSAFGDVLSYLRLFALGLATSSLALAFNGLSNQVAEAVSGIGLLLSLLILLIGHGLNLALGIMSGVVHGLRLNMIEFLKWSNPEEGYLFRPFAKKEDLKWNK